MKLWYLVPLLLIGFVGPQAAPVQGDDNPAVTAATQIYDPMDGGDKWPVNEQQFFKDGAYHMKGLRCQVRYRYRDGYASIMARCCEGSKDGTYGLAFRVEGRAGYILLVSGYGNWKLKRLSPDGDVALTGWTKGAGLKTEPGAENAIGVDCHGPVIRVLLNGQYAGQIRDETHTEGGIGPVVAWEDAEVAFRLLSVTPDAPDVPEGAPEPAVTPPTPPAATPAAPPTVKPPVAPEDTARPPVAPADTPKPPVEQETPKPPVAREDTPPPPATPVAKAEPETPAAPDMGSLDPLSEENARWSPGEGATFTDGAFHLSTPTYRTNDYFTDGYVSIKTRHCAGDLNSWYGLVFRVKSGTGYVLLVTSDCRWKVMRMSGDEWTALNETQESWALKKGGGAENVIGVLCQGPSIKVFANGQQIGEVSDGTYPSGGVGPSLNNKETEVAFNDLRVSRALTDLNDDMGVGNIWDNKSGEACGVGGWYHISVPQYQDRYLFANGYVSMKVRHCQGPLTGAYGMVFRVAGDAGYVLLVNGEGKWQLRKFSAGHDDVPITDWAESSALKHGPAENILGVLCKGPVMHIYANGQCIGETMDASHEIGGIGPVVNGSGLDIAFRELRIAAQPRVTEETPRADGMFEVTDPMSGDQAGWPVNKRTYFADGAYHITDSIYVSGRHFANGTAQIETRLVGGPLNAGYGLVFRVGHDEKGQPTGGYELLVDGAGYWTLVRMLPGKKNDQVIVPWTFSDAIRRGVGAVNVLTVNCNGSQIEPAVNGTWLGRYSDGTHAVGGIGPGVADEKLHVAFCNRYLKTDAVQLGGGR